MSGTQVTSKPVRMNLAFLAKDTALYGSARAIGLGVSFFTFPVMARHFSVEDYGLMDLMVFIGSLLATIIVWGNDSAVARFFYEYESDADRQQLISQSLMLLISVSILFVVFFFFCPLCLTPIYFQLSEIGFIDCLF